MEKGDNARRERGKNFTEKEKEIAIAVIDRYQLIVEDKATNGSPMKQRYDAWRTITEEYNATAVSTPRTVKQLKVLWSNLRRLAKKTVTEANKRKYLDQEDEDIDGALEAFKRRKIEDKQNRSKTGGGQYNSQLTEVGARVLAMVEPEARPLPNIYDDNNVYHGDVILSPSCGAILTTLLPSPTISYNPEPIPGPSHVYTTSPEIDMGDPKNLGPVNVLPTELPQIQRKKYIPPKQLKKKAKRTMAELKRTLYLKRIRLANMEISFKTKLYEIELKIKQKELDKC